MKIVKKILVLGALLFLMIPILHAANATITAVDDINNVPTIDGKRTVYTINPESYNFKILDNNFEVIDDPTIQNSKQVITRNKPTSNITYTNPYEVHLKKAAYYINDNGDAVYLNIIYHVDKLSLYFANSPYSDSADYYLFTSVYNNRSVWLDAYAMHNNGDDISQRWGAHMWLTVKVTKENGDPIDSNAASNILIPWYITDLDVSDQTVSSGTGYESSAEYRESIQFNTGFNNNFYVQNNTVLDITNNNTKFSGTEPTGNDAGSGEKNRIYSTVVAYQTSDESTFEWWGSRCGTGIETSVSLYEYPFVLNPTKSVDKEYYNVGEVVNYEVKQKFPLTINKNTATKIEVIDTFDDALDISDLTFTVSNSSNVDETDKWTKSVDGQTVTLTYNGNPTELEGIYTYSYKNLKVLNPSPSHSSVVENNATYKIIPNKAQLKITSKLNTITTKDTNIVNIKVFNSSLTLTKEVVGDENTYSRVGDIVRYKIVITNTGNSDLHDLVLNDILEGFVIDEGMQDTLAQGESITVYGHYVLTENDIKKGDKIDNTATVTAKDPDNNTLTASDSAQVDIIAAEIVNPKTGTGLVLPILTIFVASLSLAILAFGKKKIM